MGRYLAAIAVSRFPRYLVLLWAGAVFAIPTWVLAVLFLGVLLLYAWRGAPEVLRQLRQWLRER